MNKVSCHLQGGLANQLFQISATLAYAKDTNREAIFPLQTDQGCSRTKSYEDTVLRKIKREIPKGDIAVYRENGYPYNPIPKNVPKNVNIYLDGYFQSWKYFHTCKEYLKELFEPRQQDLEYIDKKYKNLFLRGGNTLSIHVRRGDYTALPDIHFNQPMTYYERAFEIIKEISSENINIFVFSDDLKWCKEQKFFKDLLKDFEVIFVDEEDYISLYMMEMCKNHIIANSSFSWMGAYFKNPLEGVVVSPKVWFGHKGPFFKMEDIALKEWIVI